MKKIEPRKLFCVVDCYGITHLVIETEYRSGKPIMETYYPGGLRIMDCRFRWKPVKLHRDSIASVAVRLRKRCALDDRIERKFRKCVTSSAF